MQNRKFLAIILIIGVCGTVSFAQSPFSGHWTGTLNQYLPNGIVHDYTMEMNISVVPGDSITGTTLAYNSSFDPDVLVKFSFDGRTQGNLLFFQEHIKMQSIEREQYVYCIKNGQLQLSYDKHLRKHVLKGYWSGVKETDGLSCYSGEIVLTKKTNMP